MVFGWGRGRGSLEQVAATDSAGAITVCTPALTGRAAGAGDVSWSPLSPGDDASRKQGLPQPFKVKAHDVRAHLQDRNTAVVDMRSVVDVPADVLFDLLADPHQHEHIFDAIESASAELVSEQGSVRRWRLDYRAKWKFWRVGGVCDNLLWMTTDRERGTVSFVLREPGFLRKYEGTWTITGPDGKGPGPKSGGSMATIVAVASPVAAEDGAAGLSRLSLNAPAAPSGSAAGDVSEPLSYMLPIPSRTTSSSSIGSSSSSGSLYRDSASALSASRCSASDSSGGCGDGVGGVGLAGLFAALNNPFTAPPPPPPPPLPQTVFDSPEGKVASAPGIALLPRPPPPPPYPTTIQVRKAISPKISPPYPINQVLKGHAAGQVNDMLQGLLLATARRIEETEVTG